jgi:hypothetical protein
VADFEEALRIGRSLPGTADSDGLGVRRKGKQQGFAWPWAERINPKKPRVPNYDVLAVRTASCDEKDALIAAEPGKFFTEPHYNGFPAVLVRLANVDSAELRELLVDAWRTRASRELVEACDLTTGTDPEAPPRPERARTRKSGTPPHT